MSIERAEKLKEILTDKFVVVDASVPELRRFQNWTGKVRTVNMNCRALVEFDGPVDIGWYDIDPDYLKVVDSPVKKVAVPAAKSAAVTPSKSAASPASKPSPAAGKSPLDAIRAQQAAKAAGGTATPAAAPTAKLSPLDMIRKQQAAKAAVATAAETSPVVAEPVEPAASVEHSTPPVPTPAPAAKVLPTTGPDGKPLSKLDMIRMQGAAKKS